MNYIDLFHGIGGFALGAYWAGMKFENHFCSDIEPYCQKLYALRFPNSIQLGDITKIDTEKLKREYPRTWIASAGIPCQPYSFNGKMLGENDERNMWPGTIKFIRSIRPASVIVENVIGAVKFFDERIIPDLENEGYEIIPVVISAEAIGGGHKRERIWIVAHDKSVRMEGLRTEGIEIAQSLDKKVLSVRDSNGQWKIEPDVCRTPYGLSGRVDRLKGLGNAIVPQIAELLFNQIKPFIQGET